MIGEEGPNAVIVHRQGMHAAPRSQRPNLDGLIGRGGHDGVPILVNQNITDIIRMPHELGNQLPRLRIPHPDHAFRAAAGDDRGDGAQGIDRAFGGAVFAAGINVENLTATVQIPEIKLVVQAAGSNPVEMTARGSQGFDVVGVLTDALGDFSGVGVRSP